MAPKIEKEEIIDIDGLVVETKFVNGSQIYSTDKISVEALTVSTPEYTASDGVVVPKKDIDLVKVVKWQKKYTPGSSDIILSQAGGMTIGKFAFMNMCEAVSKTQRTA